MDFTIRFQQKQLKNKNEICKYVTILLNNYYNKTDSTAFDIKMLKVSRLYIPACN